MANTLLHITRDGQHHPTIKSERGQNIAAKPSICNVKPEPDLHISEKKLITITCIQVKSYFLRVFAVWKRHWGKKV